LDKNIEGILTYREMKQVFAKLNSNLNVEEIFNNLDTDHSVSINYTEFLAANIDHRIYLKNERLYEAFRRFYKDNSRKIINAGNEDFRNLEVEVKKFESQWRWRN